MGAILKKVQASDKQAGEEVSKMGTIGLVVVLIVLLIWGMVNNNRRALLEKRALEDLWRQLEKDTAKKKGR